jgi:CheY-like chemotaxis protein
MLPPPASPRAHILVVDDDAGVRNVCATLLHALGYGAATASSGSNAMATLSANQAPVALVLLDLDMPEMDGGEVLRALKRHHPGLRVLMMSGRPRGDLSQYLARGATGVLRKPFGMRDLDDSVELALRA